MSNPNSQNSSAQNSKRLFQSVSRNIQKSISRIMPSTIRKGGELNLHNISHNSRKSKTSEKKNVAVFPNSEIRNNLITPMRDIFNHMTSSKKRDVRVNEEIGGHSKDDGSKHSSSASSKGGVLPAMLQLFHQSSRKHGIVRNNSAVSSLNISRFSTASSKVIRNYSKFRQLTVLVQDAGVGISEEDQKRLFFPHKWMTATGGGRRPNRGSGLGLMMRKQIIEMHGGR